MKSCKENELFLENKYNITSSLISQSSAYSCLDRSNENITNLEGSFGNPKFKMWRISIDYCKNTTENNNFCKTRQEIQRYLPVFFVHLIVSDYYLDSKDYEKPIKETYSTKILRVSSKNSRRDTFFYRTFSYFSDSGLILKEKSYKKGFYFTKFETDCLYDPDTKEILRVNLSLKKYRVNLRKKLRKIPKNRS